MIELSQWTHTPYDRSDRYALRPIVRRMSYAPLGLTAEAHKRSAYHVTAISAIAVDQKDNPLAFHVALSPKGYLIISGNDLISPVIAFSATNDLNLTAHPDNAFRALLLSDLDRCRRALADATTRSTALGNLQDKDISKNQRLWQKLLAPDSVTDLTRKSAGDSPLIASFRMKLKLETPV